MGTKPVFDDEYHLRKREEMQRAHEVARRHKAALRAADVRELGKLASDKAIEAVEKVLADLRTTEYEAALRVAQSQMADWFRRIIAAAPLCEGPEWPQHNYSPKKTAA